MFRGTGIVANIFIASLCARNCIPAIKLLAISKTAKLDFFCFFGANRGGFGGVPRCFEGSQFLLVSLRTRNCIPAIKLLAIPKTARLEFFRIFGANKGSFGGVRRCFGCSQFFCI